VQHGVGALLSEQRGKRGAFAQIKFRKAQATLGNAIQGIDGALMTAHQGIHGHHAGGSTRK
jgi:hypothetical protein